MKEIAVGGSAHLCEAFENVYVLNLLNHYLRNSTSREFGYRNTHTGAQAIDYNVTTLYAIQPLINTGVR